MTGHTWLRLVAALLVCLIGGTPSGARRIESAPPGVDERTAFPVVARVEGRDGPGCTAHVVPTMGGDLRPAPAAATLPPAPSVAIDHAIAITTHTHRDTPRGRVLPRGPPRPTSRV